MRPFLILVPILYALDQFTKLLVHHNFHIGEFYPVIPGFFNLCYVTNTGAAFGIMQNSNLIFIGISLVALAALFFLHRAGQFRDRWSRAGLVLLIPGILGNLTDRIVHAYVVDFLDFYVGRNHWPSFNLADSYICLAAMCLVIGSVALPQVSKKAV